MKSNIRNSGIDNVGKIPWGTHFCQFYQTKEDIMDVLVPYFKAGLENNEFCLWITSQHLKVEEAKKALRKVVPGFDDYLEKGQVEIIPYADWYLKKDIFNSEKLLNGLIEKLNHALTSGYDGLRTAGTTFWLRKEDWDDFVNYERKVDRIIGKYQMISLCTYSLDRCKSIEITEVFSNHQFSLSKRKGNGSG